MSINMNVRSLQKIVALLLFCAPLPIAAQSAGDASPEYSRKGADTCIACHDEQATLDLFQTKHGVPSDPRSPFGRGQLQCEACHGARYNRETLQVGYKGKSIADVLDMTANQAAEFLANIPRIKRKLETLRDVGLGYIKLGQSATTLSGGEAQRVKLAKELGKRSTGRTIYILDEPTTGLHFDDISRLLSVLQRLVESGNSVVIIEHNLDVIKTADHVIDLGPEGGSRGGEIIASGTPEDVARCARSYTGRYLRSYLSL